MAERSASSLARRRRARRRRFTALAVGVVVVAGGGSAALAAAGGDAATPVVATAVTGPVTQIVESSGTVDSSSQTAASFAADGTVRVVRVQQGQRVTKGQVLARLDTGTLQDAVDSADATVARAKQTLAGDKTGQTTGLATTTPTTSGSVVTDAYSETALTDKPAATAVLTSSARTTTPPSSNPPGTTSGGGKSSALTALVTQITTAQKNVLTAQPVVDTDQAAVDQAQHVVDDAITQNSTLRDAQKSACASSAPTGGAAPSGSPTSASPGSSDCASAQADYEAYADTLAADMAGLDKAITAQDSAIKTLDTTITALDTLLAKLPAAAAAAGSGGSGGATGGGSTGGGSTGGGSGTPGGGTGTPGTGTGTTTPSGGSAPSGTGTSGTTPQGSGSTTQTTSQPASASQLAADQASIDSAQAQRKVAEQNLAAATLRSPITGTVSTIGFTVGADSSGESITILGTGNQVVKISVPLSQIDMVKVGQPARIAVDGRTDSLRGTVTKIGLLSSTSGSLTTFPVTVTLTDGAPKLHNGAGADVTITTGSVKSATIIPNAAITTTGTRHTVNLVHGGKTTETAISVGLTGTSTSQVTSGVKVGDKVQLADPGKALPSSATSSNSSTTGRGLTGFPGGGTFPNFALGGR